MPDAIVCKAALMGITLDWLSRGLAFRYLGSSYVAGEDPSEQQIQHAWNEVCKFWERERATRAGEFTP